MTEAEGRTPEETAGADDGGWPTGPEAELDDDRDADGEAEGFEDDLDDDREAPIAPGAAGAAAVAAASRRPTRRGAAEAAHVPTASERAVHIDDRISKIFVAGVAIVFGLIFMNGTTGAPAATEDGDGGAYIDLCRQCHAQGSYGATGSTYPNNP